MKWILFAAAALVALVIIVAAVGSMLPREHKASRTLTIKRAPVEVWPVLLHAMQSSSVPVDVLESQPPTRLVTRDRDGKELRRHVDDRPLGQYHHDHRGRLGRQSNLPVRVTLRDRSPRDDGRNPDAGGEESQRTRDAFGRVSFSARTAGSPETFAPRSRPSVPALRQPLPAARR